MVGWPIRTRRCFLAVDNDKEGRVRQCFKRGVRGSWVAYQLSARRLRDVGGSTGSVVRDGLVPCPDGGLAAEGARRAKVGARRADAGRVERGVGSGDDGHADSLGGHVVVEPGVVVSVRGVERTGCRCEDEGGGEGGRKRVLGKRWVKGSVRPRDTLPKGAILEQGVTKGRDELQQATNREHRGSTWCCAQSIGPTRNASRPFGVCSSSQIRETVGCSGAQRDGARDARTRAAFL